MRQIEKQSALHFRKQFKMLYHLSDKLSKLIGKTAKLPTLLIMCYGLAAQFVIMFGFAFFWWKDVREQFEFGSKTMEILLVVIGAPIVETIIFQYAIID